MHRSLADYYGLLPPARNKLTTMGGWDAVGDEFSALAIEVNAVSDGSFRAPSAYVARLARKRT